MYRWATSGWSGMHSKARFSLSSFASGSLGPLCAGFFASGLESTKQRARPARPKNHEPVGSTRLHSSMAALSPRAARPSPTAKSTVATPSAKFRRFRPLSRRPSMIREVCSICRTPFLKAPMSSDSVGAFISSSSFHTEKASSVVLAQSFSRWKASKMPFRRTIAQRYSGTAHAGGGNRPVQQKANQDRPATGPCHGLERIQRKIPRAGAFMCASNRSQFLTAC
mmetsp:Transcript_5397/g.15634  ORF Transcript_5397/g.15634 Transcript_5397/m.15634 type:complete len:224 (-) Transcript_5397:159-830(-)